MKAAQLFQLSEQLVDINFLEIGETSIKRVSKHVQSASG